MAKLKTVSGAEINYKATEVSAVITSKVEFELNGNKDFVMVTHTKDNLEEATLTAIEGVSGTFREAQLKARQEENNKRMKELA